MPPEPLTRQLLLVATAHIHWDPEFSDVKMVQTMMLMWELQKFVEEATRKHQLPFPGPYNCNSIPFVFCGDLNSLPDSGEKGRQTCVGWPGGRVGRGGGVVV